MRFAENSLKSISMTLQTELKGFVVFLRHLVARFFNQQDFWKALIDCFDILHEDRHPPLKISFWLGVVVNA